MNLFASSGIINLLYPTKISLLMVVTFNQLTINKKEYLIKVEKYYESLMFRPFGARKK
jgi:hypothetical protein